MPTEHTIPLPTVERFYSHLETTGDCWLWTGTKDHGGQGYGSFYVTRGHFGSAHRFAYLVAAGSIPDGLFVLHTCDNPACCRNDDEGWYEVNGILHPRRGHLWLGTHQDNMDDMAAKGRSNCVGSTITHCKNGHEFTESNTYYCDRKGWRGRKCRTCNRLAVARYKERKGGRG